jgi:hypothetical protein
LAPIRERFEDVRVASRRGDLHAGVAEAPGQSPAETWSCADDYRDLFRHL